MTVIKGDDIVESVAAALQHAACHHPPDFIRHLSAAYAREESPAAKDAIAQILVNSRMAALGRRPVCQDTGIVNVFLDIGMNVRFDTDRTLDELVNEGVRRAYTDAANPLRASIVAEPLFARTNTQDNTPAVIHTTLVPGDRLGITVMAKGGGAENKSRFAVLMPSDSLVDWVLDTIPRLGAGWCPPGMLGIGVGGTAEKAMLLAKQSLTDPIDMDELLRRGTRTREEELRLEIYDKVNALGIGAQGLGGLTAVLDVKLRSYPTHASALPVALIPNCAATRRASVVLDGSGPAFPEPPDLSLWPEIVLDRSLDWIRRVDLDSLTREQMADWRPGETLLLSGRLLTGRDAAHKRIADMLARGEPLPVSFEGRAIYYVGPVDPVGDEAVGPAGPTTSTRMDKFTDLMLERTGLLTMIGKAERGPQAIEAIRRHRATYLIAVGGAAVLVSKAIRSARVVGFADLGMEAIYEFTVEDMPVTVAVDAGGTSVHTLGPAAWRGRRSTIPHR